MTEEMRWEQLREAAGRTKSPRQTDVVPIDDSERPMPPKYEPYLLDDDLAAATEISIRLRQPLLLTGDPGTGKTRFARALAHHLNLPLIVCGIRSTTTAADLFYSIDELSRFRDAQDRGSVKYAIEYYTTFNGLGRAILFAGGPRAPLTLLRSRLPRQNEVLEEHSSRLRLFSDLYPESAFPTDEGSRVVVLLDEFDKAPRDTPNDILNEIQEMAFDIPEIGVRLSAPLELRPIIIVTSNSERGLPDPFLRRCVYHDIAFPDRDPMRLQRIVWSHLKPFDEADSPLLNEILDLFLKIRSPNNRLTRRPGTAELLDWLRALTEGKHPLDPRRSIASQNGGQIVLSSLSAVVKARDDRPIIERLVRDALELESRR